MTPLDASKLNRNDPLLFSPSDPQRQPVFGKVLSRSHRTHLRIEWSDGAIMTYSYGDPIWAKIERADEPLIATLPLL